MNGRIRYPPSNYANDQPQHVNVTQIFQHTDLALHPLSDVIIKQSQQTYCNDKKLSEVRDNFITERQSVDNGQQLLPVGISSIQGCTTNCFSAPVLAGSTKVSNFCASSRFSPSSMKSPQFITLPSSELPNRTSEISNNIYPTSKNLPEVLKRGFPSQDALSLKSNSANGEHNRGTPVSQLSTQPVVVHLWLETQDEHLPGTHNKLIDISLFTTSHSRGGHLGDRSPAIHPHDTREDAYSRAPRLLPSARYLASLQTTFARLLVCGFYFGKMSIDEASEHLRESPIGTFLLRDSSDCRFLFALSVKTHRGPTSIRISYVDPGVFRLDSDEDQARVMPTFDCVLALLRHYVMLSCERHQFLFQNDYVFLESSGRKDTPVLLIRPLVIRPERLGYICRRRINGLVEGRSVERLHLTPSLRKYLTDYPYDF